MALAQFGQALGLGGYGGGSAITLQNLLSAEADGAFADFADAPAKKAAGEVIAKEFGFGLEDTVATNTIDAFADPAKALKAYQDKRAELDQEAAGIFRKAAWDAEKLGASKSMAIEYAQGRAADFHKAKMQLIKIEYPFAGDTNKLLEIATGARKAGKVKGKMPA